MTAIDEWMRVAAEKKRKEKRLGSALDRLLPKSYRHTFESDAAFSEVPSLAMMNISHLRCGACVGV